MTERQNIEIDYCPKCRGIWLDRGELDKIIERTEQVAPNQPFPQEPRYEKNNNHYGYSKHGKRKSMLVELFDF